MAISKIKKIKIISSQENKDKLVDFFQDRGLIQVTSTEEFPTLQTISVSTSDLREKLENIREILEFSRKLKKDLGKVSLTEEEFKDLVKEFNYSEFLKKVREIKIQIGDLNSLKIKLEENYRYLSVWKNLDLSLEYLLPTLYTESLLGLIPRKKFPKFLKEINTLKNYWKKINEDRKNIYILIVYLVSDKEELFSLLKRFNFDFVGLPYKKGKICDILRSIEEEIRGLDEKLISLEESLDELAGEIPKLMAVYDYLLNVKKSLDIQGNFRKTTSSVLIEGWIRERDIAYLKRDLELNFKETAVFVSEPLSKEKVPVALENRRPFRPFEVVTNLYGAPLYGWIDPTPFLAIFFVLSFALCLGDAGYGILLATISYFALKKFRLGKTTKKLFQLFLICGLSTVITGAITGAWFGNLLDRNLFLKSIKDRILLFDPLRQPLNFLFLALGLGFFQVLFGIFLRFSKELKNRMYFEAFFKELPSILIQVSLLFLLFALFKILPSKILIFSFVTLSLSFFLFIFYQFKAQKEFIFKIFWSVYGIYGIIAGNFLADILSFCRIFALGLTTSLLATAINEVYFILPVLFRTILIPAFILVHLLNLGINLLGVYVHTSRLQYLEFFTKFFESQEEIFKPFRREFEFVQLEKGG